MNETQTETKSLVIERDLPHSPEKVWHALTDSTLISEWLMKNDFAPNPGHRFTFSMDPVPGWNGVINSEVLAVEPYTRLSYTWVTSGEADFLNLATTVTWTLTEQSNGTHLKIEQTGFPLDAKANYNGAKYGWNMFLDKMEKVVDGLP
jgi:uncharacterized protein YndB with AHSA1/START domain